MIIRILSHPIARPGSRLLLVGCLVSMLSGLIPAKAAEPDVMTDADCLLCHEDRDLTMTDEAGRERSIFVDELLLRSSTHATNSCASCHTDVAYEHPDDGVKIGAVDCTICHAEQSASYGASAHGLAAEQGQAGVATCVDCHGAHSVLPVASPDAPMNRAHLAQSCGACHEQESNDVMQSVHGQALAKGRRDAPTCTDCHSEHAIEDLRTASPIEASQRTCSRCHASERINAKYRLPNDRVRTFLGSYHGLAARLGSTRAANCASCHGVHRVLPSTDANSTTHPDNLVATCGRCHPGATENFALGRVHVDLESDDTDIGSVLNRWVRRIYLGLILITIGGLAMHNGLIWWRKALTARRALGPDCPVRMSRNHRIQHGLLAVSFILLAWSGFALKFPDSWLAWSLGSDEPIRRWIHRGAALVMILLSFYHLLHVLVSREGRRLLLDLLPSRQDLQDGFSNLRYGFGRRAEQAHPQTRFGYVEKLEYWAVVWGTVIMGTTGFIVWFPVQVTWFLPRWVVEVATTIHYYEAVLACLAILVWHIYHVVFDPDVYPLNWAFWDGRARPHTPSSQVEGRETAALRSQSKPPGQKDRDTNLPDGTEQPYRTI